ncbi:MAG: YjbQ family protein [Gammaproteobacteria bacterium]|nr:YjbQ family protein [Gammaproteobacteria bacterium]NVK88517.1 YjbQ family protein [Gammaproteobacteria bacterium]
MWGDVASEVPLANVTSQSITVTTDGQGLYEFTGALRQSLPALAGDGLCTVFVRHTSCSLIIQENADPSAKRDLEQWLKRLVPEQDPLYTHTFEGPDDMPAHIKAALTATSLSIPIAKGQLVLGTWQGIYLWEHRHQSQRREVVISVING